MATPLAGQIVRASDITVPRFIRKPANQSVTSSTTLTNDTDFVVALPIGTWEIRTYLAANGATAAGIKVGWTFSGTATISKSSFGPGNNVTSVTNAENVNMTGVAFTSSRQFGIVTAADNTAIHEQLLCEVTAAGTLQMVWAQTVSNATATMVTGSSRMMITAVEAF